MALHISQKTFVARGSKALDYILNGFYGYIERSDRPRSDAREHCDAGCPEDAS
jgi:hypothetical protein